MYELEQSFLYRLRNKNKLAEKLRLPKGFFNHSLQIQYNNFDIVQNDKVRTINNPCPYLKDIQRKLLRFLQRIITPDWLISGKKNRTYINNAKYHIEHEYVLTADICKFYNNCKDEYIINMFRNKFKMTLDVAGILTQLVCLDGFLPTGSPTSQIIAYWTYSNIFENINRIAVDNDCVFSLYVDDMTFSSSKPISEKVIYIVNRELKEVGLFLKTSKTKRYFKKDCKLITGTVIDSQGALKVPNKRRLSIINAYRKYSKSDGVEKEKFKSSVIGKINSARQIEKGIFPNLHNGLKKNV